MTVMKKFVSVCLVIFLAAMLFGCDETILKDCESQIVALCDGAAEEVNEMVKSFCTVNAIEYSINNMCFHPSRSNTVLLDLTWYIDTEAETINKHTLKDYFIKDLTLEARTITVDNISYTITHTSADNKDSLYVSLNGNDPYSGIDAFNNAMQRAAEREMICCICNTREGELVKYGTHYYCPTHYEWAVSVVKNSR